MAQRILDSFTEPVQLGDQRLHVQASIGIAISEDDSTLEQRLREADMAMYESKRLGKNRVVVHDEALAGTGRSGTAVARS